MPLTLTRSRLLSLARRYGYGQAATRRWRYVAEVDGREWYERTRNVAGRREVVSELYIDAEGVCWEPDGMTWRVVRDVGKILWGGM